MKKSDNITDATNHVNDSKKEKKSINPRPPGVDDETFMAIVKAMARLRTAEKRKEKIVNELVALKAEECRAGSRTWERRREHEDAFYRNGERLFERVTEADLWKRLVAAYRDERRVMVRTAVVENKLDMINADIEYLTGAVDRMRKEIEAKVSMFTAKN